MMPWVYEFRWEPGHIIFLAFFFSVAIVTAAATIPDSFKGLVNLLDAVGHQPGKAEVAKGLEKVDLLVAERELLLIHVNLLQLANCNTLKSDLLHLTHGW